MRPASKLKLPERSRELGAFACAAAGAAGGAAAVSDFGDFDFDFDFDLDLDFFFLDLSAFFFDEAPMVHSLRCLQGGRWFL